jgi:hypothetical protein
MPLTTTAMAAFARPGPMLSARSSPVEPVGNSLVLLSGSVIFMEIII